MRWLAPLLFFSCAVWIVLLPRAARAAPPRPASLDDAVADGDIDREDLVARAPWAGLPRATVGRAVARAAPGGSAWVSLLGFASSSSATGASELGAALVIGLPLERLASRAPPRMGGPSDLVRASNSSPVPASSPRAMAPPAVVLSAPLARACVAAAWRAAGLANGAWGDDARIDAIASRARWSALLPEARLRAVRGEDERASLESNADTSRIRGSASADLALEARLTWRLDRLLFADDEPAFERLRLERHDARMRIAARTLEALFHWQRALVDLRAATGTTDATDAPELYVRVLEAEATLDVLTHGWFGQVREARVLLVPAAPGAEPGRREEDDLGRSSPVAPRTGGST